MIRIVVVDDHELVRTGFKLMLEAQPDFKVIGEAGNAEEGIHLIRRLRPDVALVDVYLPGISGVELTERLVRSSLPVRIVVVTLMDDARLSRRLLNIGALAYVTKGCPMDELFDAVRHAARGRRFLGSRVARQMALSVLEGSESPFERLTRRELEVAMMLARGMQLTDIAAHLSLSPKTVSTHKQRLLDKLQLNHVVGLVQLMASHGMALPPREEH